MPSSRGRSDTSLTEIDRAHVRRQLTDLGVRPSKRLGQNFLVDPTVAQRVADEASRESARCLVEIGPGLGSITRRLCRSGAPIVAVEIDRRLAEHLAGEFAGCPSVEIRAEDVLTVDLEEIAARHGGSVTVVGSIPYSITAPILKWIVSHRTRIRSAVLVTQREVADKIAASPGKDGSSLGVYVQAYADVAVIGRIPRGAFFPVPEVDSSLWSLRFGRPPRFSASEGAFFAVVRALYGARRKTARNALRRFLPAEDVGRVLEAANVAGVARGETLGFPQLDAVAREVEGLDGAWGGTFAAGGDKTSDS